MPAFWDRDLLVAAPALADHWRRSLSQQAEAHAAALAGSARARLLAAPSAGTVHDDVMDQILL
jgi:hypothetical protein